MNTTVIFDRSPSTGAATGATQSSEKITDVSADPAAAPSARGPIRRLLSPLAAARAAVLSEGCDKVYDWHTTNIGL
jgi:hypothetical protein